MIQWNQWLAIQKARYVVYKYIYGHNFQWKLKATMLLLKIQQIASKLSRSSIYFVFYQNVKCSWVNIRRGTVGGTKSPLRQRQTKQRQETRWRHSVTSQTSSGGKQSWNIKSWHFCFIRPFFHRWMQTILIMMQNDCNQLKLFQSGDYVIMVTGLSVIMSPVKKSFEGLLSPPLTFSTV